VASSNTQDFSDPAMLELFRAEVESHTQALNEGLLALEKDPSQLRLIESLMRAAHSIKGAARIVGVEDGVRVSHVMEDCLVAAQNGQIALSSEAIDILLRGVDALIRIASPDQAAPDAAALDRLLQDIGAIRQDKPRGAKKPLLPEEPFSSTPQPASTTPPPSPGIPVVIDGNLRTLCLPGNLDAGAAEQLRLVLVEQLDAGARDFRLDLTAVHEVDVEGLALLTAFGNMVRDQAPPDLAKRDGALELIHVGQEVAALFRLSGLGSLYRMEAGGS
jgi:chemotaxis protein histidine kinase CheA